MSKTFNIKKLPFKKSNFKAFFFFLIFSVLIWALVQFSKQYQQVVNVPIYFKSIPKDKIIEEKKASFKVRVTGDGFRLGVLSLSSPSITIDLDELPCDESYIYYSLAKKKSEIEEKLELDFKNVVFLEDQVKIPYQQKEVKTVVIEPQITVDFAPGYASNGILKINPDSVKISGTKKVLDTITRIKTKRLNLKKSKQNLTGRVALDTVALKGISFYKNAVNYSLDVEKFTEGKVEVPVTVMNMPKKINLSIFPKEIAVIFKVSLKNYRRVSKSNFRIVCDFKDVQEGRNFLIPRLVEKPNFITSYRLNVNKVQFVIKK